MLETIIPSISLPHLDEGTDMNPRRVTLLYKKDTDLVCLISRGLEEVGFGSTIEDSFLLALRGKKSQFQYIPRLSLSEGHACDVSFPITDTEDTNGTKKKKKIPYQRSTFVSEIVSQGLYDKINGLIEVKNEMLIKGMEHVAEKGLWRTLLLGRDKELKNQNKELTDALSKNLNSFFHEEQNDVPVPKRAYSSIDRQLPKLFSGPAIHTKSELFKTMTLAMATFSLAPQSGMDYLLQDAKKKHEKRWERIGEEIKDDVEKEAIAIGSLLNDNPKFVQGLRRIYSDVKAASNIGTYSLQAGANYMAYQFLSPWISIPLMIPTAISGAFMIRNAIVSGGIDYSGIFGTISEEIVKEKLKD